MQSKRVCLTHALTVACVVAVGLCPAHSVRLGGPSRVC
jgi:hypothetical protein